MRVCPAQSVRSRPGCSSLIIFSNKDLDEMKAVRPEPLSDMDEQIFRVSVESMSDAFSIYSAVRGPSSLIVDFRIEYVNEAACQLSQMEADEMVGHNLTELFSGLEEMAIFRQYVRTMETGEPLIAQTSDSYGNYWGDFHPERTYDFRANKFGDRIVVVWRDVTEQKRTASDLEVSLARYRGLFETVKEAFYINRLIYDSKGNIVDWTYEEVNPAGLEILQVASMNAIKGRTGSQVIGRELVPFYLSMIERTRYSAMPETFVYHSPWSDRDYVSSFAIIGDRWICSQTDITDIKRAQRASEEYSKMLAQSNADLEQFAYLASHDLQEPIRMVLGYLTMLDRSIPKDRDNKVQEYIRNAMEGGIRMRKLIDNLLEYSRVETSGKPFKRLDMNELMLNALLSLKNEIEESHAQISVGSLPSVDGDESQLLRVLQNLVANAIKFHGGEIPEINISSLPCNEGWVFAVKDNGIGLGMEHSERIFRMFQRLHASEEYPGTGVGLAIAKKIIERHGGSIWVESEEGKGATFYFTLPRFTGHSVDIRDLERT